MPRRFVLRDERLDIRQTSIFNRKDPMTAVTYEGARTPDTVVAKRVQNEPRKGFFARFMTALRETRRQQARRVIERYADLLWSDEF
jgi:hypothetical protein